MASEGIDLATVQAMNCAPGQTRRNGQLLAAQGGYSIIEMMTVVMIVGILAGIAITSYRGQLPQSRLRESTTSLHSTINLARVMAMSQNATMTVQMTGGTTTTAGTTVTLTNPITVSVVRTLGGADSTVGTSTMVFHNDVSSLSITPGFVSGTTKPWVRFSSMGFRAGTGNQLIVLTNSQGRVHSINVTPGGKAQWCLKATCP